MKLVHRPGKNHGNADGLSRLGSSDVGCTEYEAMSTLNTLPCGGCKVLCEGPMETGEGSKKKWIV